MSIVVACVHGDYNVTSIHVRCALSARALLRHLIDVNLEIELFNNCSQRKIDRAWLPH